MFADSLGGSKAIAVILAGHGVGIIAQLGGDGALGSEFVTRCRGNILPGPVDKVAKC